MQTVVGADQAMVHGARKFTVEEEKLDDAVGREILVPRSRHLVRTREIHPELKAP